MDYPESDETSSSSQPSSIDLHPLARRDSMRKLTVVPLDNEECEVESANDFMDFDDSVADKDYHPSRRENSSSTDSGDDKYSGKKTSTLARGLSKRFSMVSKRLEALRSKGPQEVAVPIGSLPRGNMSAKDVTEALKNVELEQLCNSSFKFNPKSGEYYVMEWRDKEELNSLATADPYQWKNNSGRKNDHAFIERKYYTLTPEYLEYMSKSKKEREGEPLPQMSCADFKKFTYEIKPEHIEETKTKKRMMLVHYQGDPSKGALKDSTSLRKKGRPPMHAETEKKQDIKERHVSDDENDDEFMVGVRDGMSVHDDSDDFLPLGRRDVPVRNKSFDEIIDVHELNLDAPKPYMPTRHQSFDKLVADAPVATEKTHTSKFEDAAHIQMKNKNAALTTEQVERCFEMSDENEWFQEAYGKVMARPPGGKVFPYDIQNVRKHDKDFAKALLTDGYQWKLRTTSILKEGSNIQMQQWDVYTVDADGKRLSTTDFKRRLYYDLTKNKALVHYYGDHDVAMKGKHGNSKTNIQVHYKNTALIEKEIRKNPKAMPTALYNAMCSKTAPGVLGVLTQPQNVDQVKYQLKKTREEITLNDNIVNNAMHIDKYTGDHFVRRITAAPEVSTILMTKKGQDEFNTMCKRTPEDEPVITGYDTTFNYGPQYVSWLNYRHNQLERRHPDAGTKNESPIIPLTAMVHQSRAPFEHETNFNLLRHNLDVDGRKCAVVMDREFVNLETLKGAKNVSCHNHLKDNVKRKVDDMGVKEREAKKQIKNEFNQLLLSSTEHTYNRRKQDFFRGVGNVHPIWSDQRFQEYFDNNLDQVVRERAGRWILDELNIDSRSGITSNSCETLNSQFKHNQPDPQATLPKAMLDIREFLAHEERNVEMAYFGRGPYQLKAEYRHLQRDIHEMPAFDIKTPEELSKEINTVLGKVGEKVDLATQAVPKVKDPTMQEAAKWLYDHERFELAPKTGVWLVGDVNEDLNRDQKIVKLEPPSCTCGAGTMCPHMLCVLKASGFRPNFEVYDNEMKVLNKSKPLGWKPGRKAVTAMDTKSKGIIKPTTTATKKIRKTGFFSFDPRRVMSKDNTPSTTPAPTMLRTTGDKDRPDSPTQSSSDIDSKKMKSGILGPIRRALSGAKSNEKTATLPVTPPVTTAMSVATTSTAVTTAIPTAVTNAVSTAVTTAIPTAVSTAMTTAVTNAVTTQVTTAQTSTKNSSTVAHASDNTELQAGEKLYTVDCPEGKIPEDYYPPRNSCTIFTHEDEPIMALVNTKSGNVSAIVAKESHLIDKKVVTPEVKHAIGKCLQYESVVGDGSYFPAAEYQLCSTAREDLESESLLALRNDQYYDGDAVKPLHVNLNCYCMDPEVKGYVNPDPEMRKTTTCRSCKDKFHDKCLTDHGKDKKGFKCTPCSIETTGAFWGEGDVHNTCTLDNLTTGVALHTEIHGKALLTQMKGSEQEEVFRRVIDHTIKGEFGEGQLEWYENVVVPGHTSQVDEFEERKQIIQIKNMDRQAKGLEPLALPQEPRLNPGSLFGTLHDKTYSHLKEASTFIVRKNCDTLDCPPTERIVSSLTLDDVTTGCNVAYSQCTRCEDGIRTEKIEFQEGKQPWMIHTDVDGLEETATETLMSDEVPNIVQVQGKFFEKRTITFFDAETAGGHFVSAHRYNGDWVWYDGLQKDGMDFEHKRIRKITPDGKIA